MWVVAAEIAVIYVLSTLPTPLYVVYRQAFHFSQITLTLVFAAYVIGTIATMFFLGRLSDQIGRRPVVLISLGIAALGAIVFLCAGNTAMLFPGRILSGLAIALASGASAAWILELEPQRDPTKATQVTIAANIFGLGVGPLVSGLLAQYAPAPLRLSYVVFLFLLAPVAFLVWKSQETMRDRESIEQVSLWPRLGIPRKIRGRFVSPAIAAFSIFSVLGFYSGLIPSLLSETLQNKNHAVAGLVVAELFFVGTLAVVCTPALKARTGLFLSLVLLIPSVGLLVAAKVFHSMTILLIGTGIGGLATGTGYRSSLQVVNEMAPRDQRAELVSSYLIACYCGISLPVIGIGFLAQSTSPLVADSIFGVIIALLAIVAVFVEIKQGRER